jgi:hypothetical protein
LDGKLANLNYVRGVADPAEVLEFDESAVVLADNGGKIHTQDLIPSDVRTQAYSTHDIDQRIDEISQCKMDYERLIPENEIHQLPLKRLLIAATRNALAKSECERDYFFCLFLPNQEIAVINTNKTGSNNISFCKEAEKLLTPRSEVYIDPRHLFGLLTNVYHWNNAEIGSQYITRRYPNELDRKAQRFSN